MSPQTGAADEITRPATETTAAAQLHWGQNQIRAFFIAGALRVTRRVTRRVKDIIAGALVGAVTGAVAGAGSGAALGGAGTAGLAGAAGGAASGAALGLTSGAVAGAALATANPDVLGSNLKWTKHFGTWRINCPQPTTAVHIPDKWTAPKCWAKQGVLHCLTTPAPTSEGRAAPRSMKGKMSSAVHNRWIASGREYAPWHYEDDHVMQSPEGNLTTPPIQTKESLHELPVDFTAGFEEKTRHRMVANSWHTGVARLLIWILLLQLGAEAAVPRPVQGTSFDGLRYMQRVWTEPLRHGQGPNTPSASSQVENIQDMDAHWAAAMTLSHPDMEVLINEPGIEQVLDRRQQLDMDLNTLRRRVCDEVEAMRHILRDHTEEWFDSLPGHIQKLYQSADLAIQVPLMQTLSREFHWGDETLLQELTTGFQLLGDLSAGWCWPARTDNKYSEPLPLMDFYVANEQYIHKKCRQHRVDPHWKKLAKDIAEEVRLSRMEGPFQAPSSWPIKTVALEMFPQTTTLLPGPSKHVATSVAFSILQVGSDGADKIRRGEDWRRGLQNSTVRVQDAPVNHRTPAFVATARSLAMRQQHGMVWATDQEDAYRQLPVAEPQHCYTLLFTAAGATLWRHRCLMFGATGSVWAYGRTADWMVYMARCLLLGCNLHYVDDFGAVEPTAEAQSSFDCSHRLWQACGFRFKHSKKQPPATEHRIQGVMMQIDGNTFTLAPDRDRLNRMLTRIQEILLQNTLTCDEASRIAGKLQFMTETLAGQAMKACLVAVYNQAHHNNQDDTLGPGLRDSLETIVFILTHIQPKVYHFDHNPVAVMYADAYLLAGDQRLSLIEALEADWDDAVTNLMENGWGWVLHLPNNETYFGHGRVPGQLAGKFTSRRAFIYALEIVAQMLPLICCRAWLPNTVWCWCDNQASQMALQKGYGRDKKINNMLSMFWSFATLSNLSPHWRRVCSAANVADPISRQDLTIAEKNGWIKVECDWQAIYMLLLQGCQSTKKATESAHLLLDHKGFIPTAQMHGGLPSRANMVEIAKAATNGTNAAKKNALYVSE
eukprot:Skav236063  [mRNA]  locus=scaffold2566:216549:230458:+ [translate_table: standard]